MKVDKAIQYLAAKIGQLEAEKALLLNQLYELNALVQELQKEVENYGNDTSNNKA